MNCKKVVLGSLVLMLTNISSLKAETLYSTDSWYLTGGAGLFYPDSDLDAADDSPSLNLRLGKELTKNIDLQVGLSYAKSDEDAASLRGGDYKQYNLSVDALYLLSRDRFRPFLLAGLGAAHNKIDYSVAPGFVPTDDITGSNTSLSGNIGLGFQYLLNDKFGLQADFRRIFSRAKFDNSEVNSSGTVANNQLNFNVLYRFGGTPAVVAVAEPMPAPAPQIVERIVEVQVPAPAPAPVIYEKQIFSAATLFSLNSAVLSDAGKYELKSKIAAPLSNHAEIKSVLIEGYTDRLGNDALNSKLSTSRANSVKNYLISEGVDASRLEAVGKGSTEPLVDCPGPRSNKVIECLQPNRRVAIQFQTEKVVSK